LALVGGAVVLFALLAFGLGIFGGNGDEERPPIIVKNGSIIFENQLATSGTGSGRSFDWTPSGNRRWKPDHENGKRIAEFYVTFRGVDCAPMTGNPVHITRQTAQSVTEVYQVIRQGFFRVDPKVVTPDDMKIDNSLPLKTLTSLDDGGSITEVAIGTSKCPIPADKKPEITIEPR
jgi:hypothetical protein